MAARSLASLDDDELTLLQFRALVVIADGRATAPGDLAALLDVHPSNATRLVDRLVGKGLLDRAEIEQDRRGIALSVTAEGRAVLGRVHRHRRQVLGEVIGRMDTDEVTAVGAALGRFASAAGEVVDEPADEAWRLGWVS